MGVAVLHPQDCLRSHYPHHQPLLSHPQYNYKPRRNPNPNVNTTPNLNAVKPRRSKRSPNGSPSPSPPQSKPSSRATSPVVGQIRILKRGEDLSPAKQPPQPQRLPATVSLPQQQQQKKKVSQSGRDSSKKFTKKNQPQQPKGACPVVADLSPGPKSVVKGMVPQKVMPFPIDAFYAGSSVFVASPPPSSLPLPAFFTSKKKSSSFSDIEDVASSDLRRLLKLGDL